MESHITRIASSMYNCCAYGTLKLMIFPSHRQEPQAAAELKAKKPKQDEAVTKVLVVVLHKNASAELAPGA